MNNIKFLVIPVLCMVLLSCNLPSNAPADETPTNALPAITETSTVAPLPSATLLPTLTPTPLVPIAWPLDKGVNCRFGPGEGWVKIGYVLVGETATIQGKNEDASWWYVITPSDPGTPCWVAAYVTQTAGNLSGLPVIPSPKAKVTGVSVKLDPKEISLPGCFGPVQPIEIKGTIDVNGPVKVEWHFEIEGEGSQSGHTTNFNSADSKNVEGDSFSPSPAEGTYWVRLVVDKPEDKYGEAKYKILCP